MEHEANTAGLPEAGRTAQRSDRHMVGPDAPLPSHFSGGGEGRCCQATARAPLNSQSSYGVGGTSKGRWGGGGDEKAVGDERLVKEARWNRKSAASGRKLNPLKMIP